MAKLSPGGLPPLFDRLVTPQEGALARGMDVSGVRDSIQRSLQALVASRSPKSIERYLASPLTTLDWGVPDFGSLSPNTEADRRLMSKVIEKAIASYEPRLRDPHVKALAPSGQSSVLVRFDIQATLTLYPLLERLSFSVGVSRAQ